MKHMTGLLFFLALLWWVLSGYTKPLLISLGIVSVLFAAFMAHRMDVVDDESHPLHLSAKLVRYWLYLLWQIVVSNVKMVQTILSPTPDINPRILRVPISQRSHLGKVVLGNSVTLTPGTVTLQIDGNEIEVHALNEESAQGVEQGDFDERVPASIEVKS
ncbi:MAG: Na+/H+ antiporter subunit E [Pseudohongiella sp.]|uniref:Na+/H+ antiporter subunit E n=1 Tax=Pseudohongiella sp. TaxID=1979412 RepID=UPI00349FEFE4